LLAVQVLSDLEIPRRADWMQLGLHFPLTTLILIAIVALVAVIALVPTYRVRAEVIGTLGIILGTLLAIDGMMTVNAAPAWVTRNTITADAALAQIPSLSHFLDELARMVDMQTFRTTYAALNDSKSADEVQRATSRLIIPDLQRFELMNIESQKENLIVASNQAAEQQAYRIGLTGHVREWSGVAICLIGIVLIFLAHRLPH
jgi:hypothetical protein